MGSGPDVGPVYPSLGNGLGGIAQTGLMHQGVGGMSWGQQAGSISVPSANITYSGVYASGGQPFYQPFVIMPSVTLPPVTPSWSGNADKVLEKIAQLKDVPAVKIAARAPDYVGTLTMWRGWTINDGKLWALGVSIGWEPRKAAKAICRQGGTHHSPEKRCSCGYWGFKTMELLQEALLPYMNEVRVIGSVEIWGKIIECENGFRAEYAYPKELWLLEDDLEHLSWTYGVPVRQLGS
jgi:hypothetical protein